MKWQRAAQTALASVALATEPALWAASPHELDADFLEFLGSVDAEAEGWGDFLARTDVSRTVAPPAKAPPTAKPPAAKPPTSKPPASPPPSSEPVPGKSP